MSTSASKSTTARKSQANLSDEEEDSYSDEFDSEDDEQENKASTPPPQKKRKAPEKTKTPTKSPDASRALSHTECKQLAADIIQGGGLANFSLNKCISEYRKQKENPYHLAAPNSAKLKTFHNKITYWKGRGRDQFNTYALSQAPTRLPASNSHSSESSRAAFRNDPVQSPPVHSPPLANYVPPPDAYIRPFQPDAPTVIMDETIRSNSAKAQVINVNLAHPEKNGPALINKVLNVEVDNVLYDGYILELQDIDNRYITELEEEAVQMNVVSPNELLLKVPSTCFPYLHSLVDEKMGRKKAGLDEPVYKNAIDATRTAIMGTTGRQFSYFKFVFPKALDNDVFTKDAEHGKIEPKLVPLSQNIQIPVFLESGKKATDSNGEYMTVFHKVCLRSNICFVIAEAEETKRRLQSGKKKNALTDQLTSMFDDMEVS